jgi:putative DNA primase/helicase
MTVPADSWIARVASVALDRFDDTMAFLGLAGGKWQAREYLPLNPKRSDHAAGSFSINADTGAWGDFATGERGRDLVSLAAYLLDEKNGEAARSLADHFGVVVPARKAGAPASERGAGKGNGSPAPQKSPSGPDSRPASSAPANSAGEAIMPVPDGAPPPPKSHPKLGAPARRWEYRDAAGRLLFLVCRFDLCEGGKEIRPLSLRRLPGGKEEWRWLGAAPPRPLYGLDRLAARPDAPAMICEGEKASDAAAALFPDHVTVTSPNGAKAADKADWSPLAGRRCVLFPDADEAGDGYAVEVCTRLHQVGAAEVLRLDASIFLALPDGAARERLPEGWDAADAVADGFSAELVAARVAAIAEAFKPMAANQHQAAGSKGDGGGEAATAPAKPHFDVDARGVWFVGTDKEGNPMRPQWVCAPLEVLARVRDPSNRGWGKLVEFADPDAVTHREIIADELLSGDGAELERKLRGWGLQIAPKRRNSLLEYLITSRPKQRARVTGRTGWHEGESGRVFVLPDRSFGDAGEVWLFDDAGQPTSSFKQRGTLDDWRREVAARCTGNSRLVFAVSLAFASPLLHVAEMESGGFHLISNSSNGKTTAMRLAASVCGGQDYMQRWRATDNGLEALAMQHCDAPLLLDELAQLDPRAAGEVAYMLANGAGKARAQRAGGMRDTARWRLLFLSAGEIGLAQHMAEAGKQTKAGQEIRIAEIQADAGAGLGVFEEIHGEANGADFARVLDRALRQCYGTAFPAFLDALVRQQGEIADTLREARKAFARRYLSEEASGQARRVADRFAMVGAGGELATKMGITGWQGGAAILAAGACFESWLSQRGGEGNQEERAMLAQVRGFLARHGEGRFTDWARPVAKDDHAPRVQNRAGWRRRVEGESSLPDEATTEYLVYPEVFREEVCKGFNATAVAKLLAARGYLKTEPGGAKLAPKFKPPGESHQRMYHVLPSLFEAE